MPDPTTADPTTADPTTADPTTAFSTTDAPPGFVAFVAAWTEGQGRPLAPLHVELAGWLEERWRAADRRLLLLAFRNSGKSTLLALFCAWLLRRDPDLRILALGGDLALAIKLVRNVRQMIELHPSTQELKPVRPGQWAAERFSVARRRESRDPSMLARGVAGNITGSHADVVICDDVEVPATSDTAAKRAKLRERLLELEFVLEPGGLQLYAGTPHTYYSIYADTARQEAGEAEPFLAAFTRKVVPVLRADGSSVWPERFPPDVIERARLRSGPNHFASQMLLLPVNPTETRLDPDRLCAYDAELDYREAGGRAALGLDGRRLVAASGWWDPSFGAPGTGDANVVAVVYTDDAGERWLHRVRYLVHEGGKAGIADPADARAIEPVAIRLCRQVAVFAREALLPVLRVETNGLGQFLPDLLRRAMAEAGVACAVVGEYSSASKDSRILGAFDAVLAAGMLHAHRSVWDTPFVAEMREWRPGRSGRDDGLDAVAGCLLAEPRPIPRAGPAVRRPDWRPGARPTVATTDFDI